MIEREPSAPGRGLDSLAGEEHLGDLWSAAADRLAAYGRSDMAAAIRAGTPVLAEGGTAVEVCYPAAASAHAVRLVEWSPTFAAVLAANLGRPIAVRVVVIDEDGDEVLLDPARVARTV